MISDNNAVKTVLHSSTSKVTGETRNKAMKPQPGRRRKLVGHCSRRSIHCTQSAVTVRYSRLRCQRAWKAGDREKIMRGISVGYGGKRDGHRRRARTDMMMTGAGLKVSYAGNERATGPGSMPELMGDPRDADIKSKLVAEKRPATKNVELSGEQTPPRGRMPQTAVSGSSLDMPPCRNVRSCQVKKCPRGRQGCSREMSFSSP